MVLKEDGTMTDSTMPTPGPGAPPIAYWTQKWDMNDDIGQHRDGVLHISFMDKDGKSVKNNFFKIISLSETKLVIQDLYHGHGTGIWTRITEKR